MTQTDVLNIIPTIAVFFGLIVSLLILGIPGVKLRRKK